MTAKIERIFGPYGTRLQEIGQKIGEPQLNNPVAILNGHGARGAVGTVAQEYLNHGATIGTVNASGLRGLLHRAGEEGVYGDAMRTQWEILNAMVARTRKRIPTFVSLGPVGDCYQPESAPTTVEARDFHERQAATAKTLDVTAACFETVNTIQEGIGIAKANQKIGMPCIISFVLDRKGKLLSGESLKDAIAAIDSATRNYPLGYGVNCCPVEALEPALRGCGKRGDRMILAYPNASSKSPRELEGGNEIITVRDPIHMARYLHYIAQKYGLRIISGCCGFSAHDIGLVSRAVRQGVMDAHLPLTDA
ncbi:MAG: homocysteine S-methyltransferase domain-containing protein [Candidatus Peregrinibacteria bacterium GW2011_GWF2_39_17]|nr:MAG: homocysteine S-methyltransferase domain-containing protein [Candidatus Peregrinibacteria bacterium GW2011_GWF2_39_17]HCW32028.1 hypothetical protein [Candidatus Peregrinibacteria bacterium]